MLYTPAISLSGINTRKDKLSNDVDRVMIVTFELKDRQSNNVVSPNKHPTFVISSATRATSLTSSLFDVVAGGGVGM